MTIECEDPTEEGCEEVYFVDPCGGAFAGGGAQRGQIQTFYLKENFIRNNNPLEMRETIENRNIEPVDTIVSPYIYAL